MILLKLFSSQGIDGVKVHFSQATGIRSQQQFPDTENMSTSSQPTKLIKNTRLSALTLRNLRLVLIGLTKQFNALKFKP